MKKKKSKTTNRNVVVFVSLFGALAVTSALLLALAPAPLTGNGIVSLFAVDTPKNLDGVFNQIHKDVPPSRWKYIYIHQSKSISGSALTLADGSTFTDHFVVGNGDGCVDGEIQMTPLWTGQESIGTPPAGVSQMDPACISICVIGDFDQSAPTTTQARRLEQLVGTLQHRLGITATRVLTVDQANSAAGIGKSFPVAGFRNQLMQ